MPGFRQRFFRQNSLYQDSPKFNNAKVSSFTVVGYELNNFFALKLSTPSTLFGTSGPKRD